MGTQIANQELLRAQIANLKFHLNKVIKERDVLRMANSKKQISLIKLSKRLKALTGKKINEH